MEENSASGNEDLRPQLFVLDELENPSKVVDCIVGEGEHLWLRESTQTFGCIRTGTAEGPLPGFDTASTGIYSCSQQTLSWIFFQKADLR